MSTMMSGYARAVTPTRLRDITPGSQATLPAIPVVPKPFKHGLVPSHLLQDILQAEVVVTMTASIVTTVILSTTLFQGYLHLQSLLHHHHLILLHRRRHIPVVEALPAVAPVLPGKRLYIPIPVADCVLEFI